MYSLFITIPYNGKKRKMSLRFPSALCYNDERSWGRKLNKPFVPMQATGFLLMLVSFVIGFGRIDRAGVGAAIVSVPGILFFAAWLGLMGFMVWYRKHKFSNEDAHSNWVAQIVNALGQTCLLLAILFAG